MRPDRSKVLRWIGLAERGLIGLSILMLTLIGFGYLMFPDALFGPIGIGGGPDAMADLRATYGGSQIATGLILLWCFLKTERQQIAIMIMFVMMTTVAISRGVAMGMEGVSSGPNLGGLFLEVFFAFVLGVLIILRRRWTAA